MQSIHLHKKLVHHLKEIGLQLSEPRLVNLALWSQALAVSSDCHLTNLALGLPIAGRRENLIQRLRRFLKQKQVGWQHGYGQLVHHLFDHWQAQEVALVMDRTDLGQRWSILVLGAAYRKRLLPLCWRVLPFGGTAAQVHCALLRQVRSYLPSQARIHCYGDCEFRAVELQQCCRAYGWHWHLGMKSDTYVYLADGHSCQLRDLPLLQGERRYWQQVYLTQQQRWGPVNLMGDWSQDHPRFWALDLPADAQAWRRGRKRFWIEPTFRDWKSYGFDLEQSQIDDPDRLQLLVLGMAVTTLWMIHLGDWLTRHGHDRWQRQPPPRLQPLSPGARLCAALPDHELVDSHRLYRQPCLAQLAFRSCCCGRWPIPDSSGRCISGRFPCPVDATSQPAELTLGNGDNTRSDCRCDGERSKVSRLCVRASYAVRFGMPCALAPKPTQRLLRDWRRLTLQAVSLQEQLYCSRPTRPPFFF